ncbi:MAG: DUF1326 domain-containing protein [Halobacteriales archaeon]|nr:DUF1326 domain-containing protein [Halobacteriales archaeon]
MTNKWTITGDYLEACNCDVACQCIWMEPPDDGVCTVSLAWHIQEGSYGDVDLGGLNATWLASCEDGNPFDPDVTWPLVVLLDERADDDQRAALEDVFAGRAGGIFGVAVETHAESVEVATAPFAFDRTGGEFSLEIGDWVSVEAVEQNGVLGELGRVSPHPFTKSLEMNTGKSTTATVSYDEEFTWDVSGNNSFLGAFELANA